VNVQYGEWDRGMLPVHIDGQHTGVLTEDADGWCYWRNVPNTPGVFELVRVSTSRRAAIGVDD
jgi:hypothetical protein